MVSDWHRVPSGISCGGASHNDGGHVRVGLEDNIFISRMVLAKSNAELVEKIAGIAQELGRDIATPDEARSVLGLKGKDKVNF